MYQRFYDLVDLPFELTPNPRYLYLSRQHREALSNLEYGLVSAKGITVLIGEAGTGKTTLLHAMLASHRCRNISCVFITNPTLTRTEFIEMLAERFTLGERAAQSKTALLSELEFLLCERQAAGVHTALVIDEAQSLSAELLEEVRLLANSETTTQKLLPLVLVGQPELRDRLNEPGLRQLKQRITLRCEIKPFTLEETTDYIATRVRTAGGDAAAMFTRDAIILIHERSGGVPRTISVLCDNALLTGCGLGQQPVTRAIVQEVARDFDLAPAARAVETSSVQRSVEPAFAYQSPYIASSPLAAVGRDRVALFEPREPVEPAQPQEPLLADKVVAGASSFFKWSVQKGRGWIKSAMSEPTPSSTRPIR
jgi:general secretion pathway protein A